MPCKDPIDLRDSIRTHLESRIQHSTGGTYVLPHNAYHHIFPQTSYQQIEDDILIQFLKQNTSMTISISTYKIETMRIPLTLTCIIQIWNHEAELMYCIRELVSTNNLSCQCPNQIFPQTSQQQIQDIIPIWFYTQNTSMTILTYTI